MIDFVMVVILGVSIGILLLFYWELQNNSSEKGKENKRSALDPVSKHTERLLKELKETGGLISAISKREDFEQYYKEEFARGVEYQQPLSLILIEIDYLQELIEYNGLIAVEQIIRNVAQMIQYTLKRNRDRIARYGPKEFIIVLPDTGVGGALFIAEQVRANIESLKIPHNKSKISRYVTVSAGVISLDQTQHASPAELLVGADKALYLAKQEGRNRIVLYQSSQNLKI